MTPLTVRWLKLLGLLAAAWTVAYWVMAGR